MSHHRSASCIGIAVGVAVFGSGAVGCALAPNSEEATQPDPAGEVAQPQTTAIGTWTDWSGTVIVKAWVCDWSPAEEHPSAVCVVPAGWVLVGGGAEIAGEPVPGALLTSNGPLNGGAYGKLKWWYVGAKDHGQSQNTQIRGYVMGLQLSGLSEAQLRNAMGITCTQSGQSNTPVAVAIIGANHILVGGGAHATYNGAGQLLFESVHAGGAWRAKSKSHIWADPGWVTACSISIERCPVGYTGGCLHTESEGASGPNMGGYTATPLWTWPTDFAMTAVGAWAISGSNGRFLTDFILHVSPTGPGGAATVWSKDHILPQVEQTEVYSIGLARE